MLEQVVTALIVLGVAWAFGDLLGRVIYRTKKEVG